MITFFEYYSSKLATSLCSDVDIELNGNVMAAVLRQGHAFSLQSIFHVYISMTYNAPMKPPTRVKAVRLITPSALTNFTFSWTSKVRLCVLCCYFNIYLALWLLFTHCTLVVCAFCASVTKDYLLTFGTINFMWRTRGFNVSVQHLSLIHISEPTRPY